MGWSERQVAMLGEMGIRVWSTPQAPAPTEAAATLQAAPPPPAVREASGAAVQAEPGSLPLGIDTLGWQALRETVEFHEPGATPGAIARQCEELGRLIS